MARESGSSGNVHVDVLDRVLDKGIVIDAAVRVSIAGIELLGVDARVVVASIETYLRHADAVAYTGLAAAPRSPPPPLYAEPLEGDLAGLTAGEPTVPDTPLDPPRVEAPPDRHPTPRPADVPHVAEPLEDG